MPFLVALPTASKEFQWKKAREITTQTNKRSQTQIQMRSKEKGKPTKKRKERGNEKPNIERNKLSIVCKHPIFHLTAYFTPAGGIITLHIKLNSLTFQ